MASATEDGVWRVLVWDGRVWFDVGLRFPSEREAVATIDYLHRHVSGLSCEARLDRFLSETILP